ncbi:hypothetical protein IFM89_022757 [Coptis chinensis]|uniref:FAR1 domain-containing protein n=1 Tax=Coptis chinensis TaxID=261450 RepID=A0A835LNJ3_9MAGN|nr:hypothetical protein IFM89_022757 [Coptis chinensis]
MEDVEGEDCEVLHSTLGKNNISSVELKPTLGMKFSSFEDAKDFYNRHAMQKGFGTKIKNSYNKKNTDQRQFTQFSCSKEGFKVEKEGVLYKRPNSRDLKRKLVDESNNSDSVEDELVETHPSESLESVQPGQGFLGYQIKSLRDKLDNWLDKIYNTVLSVEVETPYLVAA